MALILEIAAGVALAPILITVVGGCLGLIFHGIAALLKSGIIQVLLGIAAFYVLTLLLRA